MASGAFSGSNQRTEWGPWPWLMGGATFLITTLFPPLGSINYSMIPNWMSVLVAYGSQGGIGWQLLNYVRENAAAFYPLGALLGMILPFCCVPIVLTISSVLVWQRVVSRAPHPTVRRGLLAVVLATVISLLAIGLLDLLVFGIPALQSSSSNGALFGMVIFAAAALSQSLWVLPCLLIAGTILAMLQVRSRTS